MKPKGCANQSGDVMGTRHVSYEQPQSSRPNPRALAPENYDSDRSDYAGLLDAPAVACLLSAPQETPVSSITSTSLTKHNIGI